MTGDSHTSLAGHQMTSDRMRSSFNGLAVIVPTRNRSWLAYRSLQSALSVPISNLCVLVSDNSTNVEERQRLRALCEHLGDNRISYITPPTPMPMGHHWEWAINHALATFPYNHFTILTDRMLIR